MPPSTFLIKALQQAGHHVHAAAESVAQAVQSDSMKMVSTISHDPFSPQSDWEFSRLRTLSRLGHDLRMVEDKLRELYEIAEKLGSPDAPLLMALPLAAISQPSGKTTRAAQAAEVAEAAEDVVVKKASLRATKGSKKGSAKTGGQKGPRRAGNTQRQAAPMQPPAKMSPNDTRLLAGLEQGLSRKSWANMTHSAMAEASGLPSGSIGVAIKRLISLGKLSVNANGAFRLA